MTRDAIDDLNDIRDYYLLHSTAESAQKVLGAIQQRIAHWQIFLIPVLLRLVDG